MSDYVNPEPPAEIKKIKEDLIGETIYSKHWLCEFLLKVLKKVEEKEDETEGRQTEGFRELNTEFEKEMCDLWDMSVELDVCKVLDELNAIQIFQGYIIKYNSVYPRAIEILLGIFVNMASLSDHIGLKLVKNAELINFIVYDCFSPMLDVQVVTQCVRLFSLFLIGDSNVSQLNETESQSNVKLLFIEFLKHETEEEKENSIKVTNWQSIIEKFHFILEQSLNPVLLDSAVLFMLNLLDFEDPVLNRLTIDERLLETLTTACNTRMSLEKSSKTAHNYQFNSITTTNRVQLNSNNPCDQTPQVNSEQSHQLNQQTSQEDIYQIDHLMNKYFMCLQTISTNEQGVIAFYDRFDLVLNLFDEYLNKCLITLNDWEIRSSNSLKSSVDEESLQNFSCVLSVLNCVFSNYADFTSVDYLFKDFFFRLFTFSQSYLKLFNELQKSEKKSQASTIERLDENFSSLSTSIKNSLELAKFNLKELISNIQIFINNRDNIELNDLINNCILLLNNE